MNKYLSSLRKDLVSFFIFFFFYARKHLVKVLLFFEKHKNSLVKLFMMKRGRYSRPFLHFATIGILGIGVMIAPVLADTYPIFNSSASAVSKLPSPTNQDVAIAIDDNVFQTDVSQKLRDKIITYTVEKGDTISSIAEKFGISENTIRWENDLSDDSLSVGDTLQILPVTGIAYKVENGDTVYTIAKKFDTNAQEIVDFPFNNFANPETFSLVEGQILIVPDGVKPSEQPFIKKEVYIAQGPTTVVPSGGFVWPVRGIVTQFPSIYHMALDIASGVGTPIVAAKNGTVARVSVGTWDYGYGTNVVINHGDGIETLYAHMSGINVSVGQSVVAGSTVVGWIGVTGRTTGPHVHFEIRKNDVTVNPLPFLP